MEARCGLRMGPESKVWDVGFEPRKLGEWSSGDKRFSWMRNNDEKESLPDGLVTSVLRLSGFLIFLAGTCRDADW
jgi:hypothetical protein